MSFLFLWGKPLGNFQYYNSFSIYKGCLWIRKIFKLCIILFIIPNYKMDFENSGAEERLKSSWNSGGLINIRLHKLLEDCNKHKRENKYFDWKVDLDSLWCELGGDEKEGSDACNDYANLLEKLYKLIEFDEKLHLLSANSGHNKPKVEFYKLKRKVREILVEMELFLRRLQNEQGKGTAYQDGTDDYMDQ